MSCASCAMSAADGRQRCFGPSPPPPSVVARLSMLCWWPGHWPFLQAKLAASLAVDSSVPPSRFFNTTGITIKLVSLLQSRVRVVLTASSRPVAVSAACRWVEPHVVDCQVPTGLAASLLHGLERHDLSPVHRQTHLRNVRLNRLLALRSSFHKTDIQFHG